VEQRADCAARNFRSPDSSTSDRATVVHRASAPASTSRAYGDRGRCGGAARGEGKKMATAQFEAVQ